MRVATRRFSPLTHRPFAPLSPLSTSSRSLSTFLPPHPSYVDFRVLMERDQKSATNPLPNNYMPITYKEWPNGMDEDLYDVVSYLHVLQERYDAVGELLEKKGDDALIDEHYHTLYPTFVKATWGMPEFAKLPHRDLREQLDSETREALTKFVASEEGAEKLTKEREKITKTIDSVLVQTPVVLNDKEISNLLAKSAAEQDEEMWTQYGLNLEQRSTKAGVSKEDYIKSLALSDEKTINEYLRELEFEIKMIRKWQMFVPSLEVERKIRDHLKSEDVQKAIATLKSGDGISGEGEAFELLDTVIKQPKEMIRNIVVQAIREVPTGEYMETADKDFLRVSYANPEDAPGVADPVGFTKWQKAHTTDDQKWRMLRFFTVIFGACMVVQAASVVPGNLHFIKEYGHFVGYRSGYYGK